MKKILIATTNSSKLEFFQRLLSFFDIDLISLRDLNIMDGIEEDGKDELENALIKARHYYNKSGLVTLADDAGMYLDALDGQPGVKFRRWNGELPGNVSDEEWIKYLFKKMKDVKNGNRTGQFRIGRAIVTVHDEYIFQKNVEFFMSDEPVWEYYKPGWPMNVFRMESKLNKPWAILTDQERIEYESDFIDWFKNINKKI